MWLDQVFVTNLGEVGMLASPTMPTGSEVLTSPRRLMHVDEKEWACSHTTVVDALQGPLVK